MQLYSLSGTVKMQVPKHTVPSRQETWRGLACQTRRTRCEEHSGNLMPDIPPFYIEFSFLYRIHSQVGYRSVGVDADAADALAAAVVDAIFANFSPQRCFWTKWKYIPMSTVRTSILIPLKNPLYTGLWLTRHFVYTSGLQSFK